MLVCIGVLDPAPIPPTFCWVPVRHPNPNSNLYEWTNICPHVAEARGQPTYIATVTDNFCYFYC